MTQGLSSVCVCCHPIYSGGVFQEVLVTAQVTGAFLSGNPMDQMMCAPLSRFPHGTGYVCMVIKYSSSMDQAGNVANPACGQLNRKK